MRSEAFESGKCIRTYSLNFPLSRSFIGKILALTLPQFIQNYSSDQVLAHMTQKLNALYVPSPSPPPLQMKVSHLSKQSQQIEAKEHESMIENEQKEYNKTECTISTKANCKISQQNVNYSIKHASHIKTVSNKTNEEKQRSKKGASSQIYVNLKATKHKKNASMPCTKRCTQTKHGLGFKSNVIAPSTSSQFASNIFVYPPPASSNQYFVCDDEVAQKIKMHKKSRKRKQFGSMEREGFDAKQPQKKRIKMNVFGGRERGRMRMKNKGRGRGQSAKRFHRKQRENVSDNHSNEMFENNEEEELSDIDLNAISNTTNNSMSL